MIESSGQALRALRAIVRYHRSCGVHGYSGSQHIDSAVKRLSASLAVVRKSAASTESSVAPEVADTEKQPVSARVALAQLLEEVASCRMCQLHTQRVCPVVGDGGSQPRLLIVGEWPIVPSGSATGPETLFGAEEDLMVERMKTALGLSPDHVYVTSLIKCGVPAAVRPSLEQAKTCSRYVRRQVELLQPEVVCAMGTFAAQVLTGIERPLSMLRGRVLPGLLGDESQLVVVPTYHPTFLLQNPDMKSAAWQDLQLVMKKLGLQRRKA